jgi:alcohol dehydrogenase (cytochrome c)
MTYADHPTALQLRAMNIIYETTKEARRHDPDADIDGRNAMEKIMTRRLATKNILLIIAGVLVVTGVASTGVLYVYWDQAVPIVGMAINYYRSLSAPTGTTSTELASGSSGAGVVATSAPAATATPNSARGDWPSYNKTLTSERYSQLSQINTKNVGKLKVLCTYDTGQYTSFETGPIMVNGALIGTTEHDIFSIDPANCHQNWRTHEDYKPANLLAVNRGAAYLDGLLFRGTEDGRVLAYDFKTGKRVWETIIADPKLGETTLPRRSPGTALSSSAMPAETTRA